MLNSKIKAFVFDFDNTLVYSDILVVISFLEAYKKVFNQELKIEDIVKNYGPSEEGIFFNLSNDKEKSEKAFKEYLTLYGKYQSLYAPLLAKDYYNLFKIIKDNNFKLFIITGRSEESLKISLDFYKLNDYFDGYYYGSTKGVNKPDSFKKLMDEYHLKNDEIIYFGDTRNDIKSCKEVNIPLFSVTLFYNEEYYLKIKKENQNIINSYKELNEVILKLIKENQL